MTLKQVWHSRGLMVTAVWLARIIVGALFVVSGLSKADDLWGFIYKIEEYLRVWNVVCPRSIVLTASMLISGAEFVLGSLLMLGLYRRSAPALLLLTMCGMLPLTLYIYIYAPVADCGCFGDFLILSNAATFWKNVALTVLLAWLLVFNRRVSGLFSIPVQWIVGGVLSFYVLFVGMVGFGVQPMIDFRSFPVGASLVAHSDCDEASEEFEFIYESLSGVRGVFTTDSLPPDDWTFIDRRQTSGRSADARSATEFVILDGDDDITSEVIQGRGEEMLLLIPDLSRADVTYTFALNELNDYIGSHGGSMAALIGTSSEGLDSWADLSMASYPLFSAEPTLIKELARGNMSLVYLVNGVIVWKRTLSSLDAQDLMEISVQNEDYLRTLDPEVYNLFIGFTVVTCIGMFVLWLLDRSGRFIGGWWRRRRRDAAHKVDAAHNPS